MGRDSIKKGQERKKERKKEKNSRLSLSLRSTRKQQSKKGHSLSFFFFHFFSLLLDRKKVETGRERETMSGLDTNPSGMKEKKINDKLLVHI